MKEDFSKEWIIAFFADTNSFCVMKQKNYTQGCGNFEIDKEFYTEEEGIKCFKERIRDIKRLHDDMNRRLKNKLPNWIYLENTEEFWD